MADSDKVKIKPLETGDDYRLWKIRIEAACDAKNLDEVLSRERNPHSDPEKKAKFESDMRKASGIIVAALSNEPLRIVRSDIGKPYRMIKKLNERYDSKSAASRISKMTELISLRYESLSTDIGTHIDKMAGIVEQLAGMDTAIPNELAIALLIASIHVPELAPISAAIKTLPDDFATWDGVTTRLIEEQHSLKIRMHTERSAVATKHCEICDVNNHFTKECWFNPKNPDNKLNLSKNPGRSNKVRKPKMETKNLTGPDKRHGEKKKNSTKMKGPRVAVARANICSTADNNKMMLDSGTTTHMTPNANELLESEDCHVSIALGDDSSVQASSKGTKPVTWLGPQGKTVVHLSETLAARDLAMRLLSAPALTRKGMAVLFLPSKALIVDLTDSYKVIGLAPKATDGLYYIDTGGSQNAGIGTAPSSTDRAMMVIVRKFVDDHERSDGDTTDSSYSDIDDLSRSDHNEDCDPTSSTEDANSQDARKDDLVDLPNLLIDKYDDCSSSDDDEGESSKNEEYFSGNHYSTEPGFDDGSEKQTSARVDTCWMMKSTIDEAALWHSRLGHQGTRTALQKMIRNETLPTASGSTADCDPCSKGKFKRFFRGSLTKENLPGKIHADLVGRVKPMSLEGYEYFLTIIDEATRYAEVIPLRKKSDASAALILFMTRFERQSEVKIRSLHTDDGSEFFKARAKFQEMGVTVTTSTAYTPSSNGLVERTQGVLLSAARSFLSQARIPLIHWTDAIEHVTKGRNVIVHSVTGKSPYTALFGNTADYIKHMRPFGCRVLVQPVKKKLGKFETRMIEGICLGHISGGVYKVLTTNGIVKTKHVKFFETTFPGTSLLNRTTKRTIPDTFKLQVEGHSSDEDDFSARSNQPEVTMLGGQNIPEDNAGPDGHGITQAHDASQAEPFTDDPLEQLTHYPANPSSFGVSSNSEESSDSDDPEWEPTANTALPRDITTSDEPTVAEAMRSPEATMWQAAISDEFKMLKEAGTWTEPGTPTVKPLPSGVILRLKRNGEGRPAKFKARLVARGNFQRSSDYTQENSYSPVPCFDLVRILLALSAAFDWKRHQIDIKGAFLHARLPKDSHIWIRLPKIDGVLCADGSIVKLVKSLYGLRESPKLWYQTLASRLMKLGFKRLASSDCVFLLRRNRETVIILAYVDDIGLFGHERLVKFVKKKLSESFQVTDLGESKFFLGVSIKETKADIHLSQKPLIQRIIRLASMDTCKPVKTPLPLSHILYEVRSEPTKEELTDMERKPYREVLGSLLFLSTRTRPDISTAVSMLGKFAASPAPRHWNMMKYVIRYLKGTMDYGIKINKRIGHDLVAYSDADWARDEHKRRSLSGILITIGNNPVSWTSKLQPTVALSTTEAEFFALSECVREVNWIRQLLAELGLRIERPTTVYQDNLGTIRWTEEVQGLRKVKHVRLRYHFVKEAVQNKDVEVLYIPSLENKADPFTKALGGTIYPHQRNEQQVMPSTPEGGVSQN